MATKGVKERPSKLNTTRSFSRYEPASTKTPTPTRGRASTLSNEILAPDSPLSSSASSIFEKEEQKEVRTPILKDGPVSPDTPGQPDGFDDLPIELISLSDRFITSLTTARIYPTPPSIDKLTDMFQEFYVQAESHISTHIQALSLKQSREASPAPSIASRISNSGRTLNVLSSQPSKEKLSSDKTGSAQQMLTPSEISEKRKAKRRLEHLRVALEEAVERRVCEGIYPRIYRHKSSLDEIRDEKLRSKTAALSLVGITLGDLGVSFDDVPGTDSAQRAIEIKDWISKARAGLLAMNEARYPLGKLQSLAETHQNIVEMLTILHKSSSSADEILPTLIYTLISCPPEGISVISNLCFVQRFRSASKINGEAAYCLTNLEAAITFLENVDLATLRSEEAIERSSKHSTPAVMGSQETEFPFNKGPARAITPTVTTATALSSKSEPISEHIIPEPHSPTHTRRLSTLFQPSANALGAASDTIRSSADAGLKNISQAMDSSFKLLFGRLKEQNVTSGPGATVIVPTTLDEARRLVSPRPTWDEEGNISGNSSFVEPDDPLTAQSPREEKLLDLISGKGRDRSADSTSSANRKIGLGVQNAEILGHSPPSALATPISALDSMRNLGNSLNPLNRFAGVNVMRGFGRSNSTTPSPLANIDNSKEEASHSGSETTTNEKGLASPVTARIDPPIQRFLDVRDVSELRLGEVEILLRDYRRLARVVKEGRLC